jgi:tRNA dimethylallyltransferase
VSQISAKARPDAIVLAGPTASGKSALAISLARKFDGVIINADSMQVYAPLRVLTARPNEEDLAKAPHRLFGHVRGDDQYTTARWLKEGAAEIQSAWGEGRTPILVGGTGLYFNALFGGLSEVPGISDAVRAAVREQISQEGASACHAQLSKVDPASASQIDPNDGQRIARALEVYAQTGQPLSSFSKPTDSDIVLAQKQVLKLILEPARSDLHLRIETRFEGMVSQGALQEVESLLALDLPTDRTVLKAIGVPQFAAFLAGETTMDEAITRAKTATRQYAKRQSTWFRNQMGQDWVRITDAGQLEF